MTALSAAFAPLLLTLLATAPPAPGHAASLGDLAWMSGSWIGEQNGVRAEEHWTRPEGGVMLAVHRDVRDGRATSFEFLRIVERGDSLVCVALPRGRNETPFPLKELGGRRVVFENPGHDFPQRILYRQTRPNDLRARTEGTIEGRLESEEWVWRRGKLAR